MRQTGSFSQPVEIINQHSFYGYIQTNVHRKTGQTKQSAASLRSFQLQFEVIVLAVSLTSSSKQFTGEKANVLCQAK
jgi:hypothetical protein